MNTTRKIRVLVVGAGNMGRSHALAYESIPEFEIAAICTRSPESRAKLMAELPDGIPEVNEYEKALTEMKARCGLYIDLPRHPLSVCPDGFRGRMSCFY